MNLQLVSYEGVVYKKDDGYHVVDIDHGDQNLTLSLRPLQQFSQVQVLGQHFPETPMISGRWGGGCCMWESTGRCPSGHHDRPGYLFQYKSAGKLEERDNDWYLGGKKIPLDLFDGHRSRIMAVPILNPDDLKNFSGDLSDLQGVLDRLLNLQEVIKDAKDGAK